MWGNSLRTRSTKVLSISSWFCLPEMGMVDFEILSRASAFLVKPSIPVPLRLGHGKDQTLVHRNIHVVTASHVVAPWKFKKYYPDEWLQHLSENNTHYTLEIRNDDGTFMTQSDCLPRFYMHPTRDLAVLHLENESSTMDVLSKIGMTVHDIDSRVLQNGDEMVFHGHEVLGEIGEDGTDLRKPFPHTSRGVLVDRTEHQTFVRTPSPLTDGMCGGPIIASHFSEGLGSQKSGFQTKTNPKTYSVPSFRKRQQEQSVSSSSSSSSSSSASSASSATSSSSSSSSSTSTSLVCGMLEGIVPVNHPSAALRGLASIIEGHTIASFLSTIEAGTAQALEGGEAQKHVGNDKDPEKMDLQKVISRFEDVKITDDSKKSSDQPSAKPSTSNPLSADKIQG